MGASDIFVSVGSTATQEQEDFVRAIEERLRIEGLVPQTVGRNTFSSDAPLKAVIDLMRRCSGAVIIALERSYFPHGFDKPGGPKMTPLKEVRLATPWNQIEAGMSYLSNLPLLVIVQSGVRTEGLLERGYDWYVQQVVLSASSLSTPEFNGVLTSWRDKVKARAETADSATSAPSKIGDPGSMTVFQILGALKPAQLWTLLTTLAAALAGAFSMGAHLIPKK